ncbi:MAG: hypothetical protein LBS40_02390 [Burkholderiales bacterium]|jgi:hypothetical protein|nr:hypothetical protein [Burkholderiales bacterium]
MQSNTEVENQLRLLLTGLADQQILRGVNFYCDGQIMHADEVGDITFLPSLYLAQKLAQDLEVGGFGYHFMFAPEPNPFFPLQYRKTDQNQKFFAIAPFLADVFYSHVREHAADIRGIFYDVRGFLEVA